MIAIAAINMYYQFKERDENMKLYSYLKFDERFQGGPDTENIADHVGKYINSWLNNAGKNPMLS